SSESGRYYAVQMFGRPRSSAIVFRIANESGDRVDYKLDTKPYSIAPRTIMTHTICQAVDLVFLKTGDAERGANLGAVIHPRSGAEYVLHRDPQGSILVGER